MATMPSADRVTSRELLKAVERLPAAEFEDFVATVEALRARRRPDRLNAVESRLLSTINRGFPETWWRRYQALIAKRDAEALTAAEHLETRFQATNDCQVVGRHDAIVFCTQVEDRHSARFQRGGAVDGENCPRSRRQGLR
jgi:hypothetical protein